MTSIYANLWEQKNVFTGEKSSTPTGLVWDTNMTFDLWFEHLYGRGDIIIMKMLYTLSQAKLL